jgi:hypothetical protein
MIAVLVDLCLLNPTPWWWLFCTLPFYYTAALFSTILFSTCFSESKVHTLVLVFVSLTLLPAVCPRCTSQHRKHTTACLCFQMPTTVICYYCHHHTRCSSFLADWLLHHPPLLLGLDVSYIACSHLHVSFPFPSFWGGGARSKECSCVLHSHSSYGRQVPSADKENSCFVLIRR